MTARRNVLFTQSTSGPAGQRITWALELSENYNIMNDICKSLLSWSISSTLATYNCWSSSYNIMALTTCDCNIYFLWFWNTVVSFCDWIGFEKRGECESQPSFMEAIFTVARLKSVTNTHSILCDCMKLHCTKDGTTFLVSKMQHKQQRYQQWQNHIYFIACMFLFSPCVEVRYILH